MLSLTATELHRYMNCNGSRLLGGSPPFNPDDTVSKEGDACHWLIEQAFINPNPDYGDQLIDRKAPNGNYITPEMVDDSLEYLSDLRVARAAGLEVLIETDTSHAVAGLYEIRGRADAVIYDARDYVLTIPDFKYGWRIIDPKNNWTMVSHAIGWVSKYQRPVSKIIFKIYQPRPYHPEGAVREYSITYDELVKLWQQFLDVMKNPQSLCVTGDHCYKCESATQCHAHIIATMNAIDVSMGAFETVIDNNNLAKMMNNLERAQEMIKQSLRAYEDLASHRVKKGEQIDDRVIEHSYGKRKWKDDVTPELIQALSGISVIEKPKLKSPKQAELAGVPESVVKSFTHRPDNGFKLVRMSASKRAEKLFGKKD
jgi:hypothetical protein